MPGNPAHASIWPDADVYIAALGSTIPADENTPFSVAWDLIGLLDGDAGFSEERSEDINDRFAWGGIIVRTTRKNFKLTKKFTFLEWNATTRDLIYPDSPPGEIVVPRPKRLMIAFETREATKVRRLISKYQAEVAIDGSIDEKEDDLTKYPVVATIFPDGNGTLFVEQPEVGS